MKKYKLNKGFIVQKIDNKITIFDSEKSMLFTFNQTASFVFNKIKQGWDKEKVIDELVKKYQIKKEKAEKDVWEFVGELVKKGIIKPF